MRTLKRKVYLTEAEDQKKIEEQPLEPTAEELVQAIKSGKMTLDDLEMAHQNGEISDEVFAEVTQILTEGENQEVIEKLVNQINSGELSQDDLDAALANGEIDSDIYAAVAQQITDDPNIAQDEQDMGPQEEPQPIVGKYDSVRLFDHFVALKEFIATYKSAYGDIEIDQLSSFQVDRLAGLFNTIRRLESDLNFYINNTFKSEDYKKNLYAYLLFNKQFADEIGKFRHILNLDPKNIMPEEDEDKKKS